MIRLHSYGMLVAFLAALTVAAGGLAAQTSNRVQVDKETTEQKAIFVENLVTKSVAAETIESSSDTVAIENLVRARELVTAARAELDAGDFESANTKLDEALGIVNVETRRLSKDRVGEKRAQEAYDKRLKSVKTFLAAYDRMSAEKNLTSAMAAQIEAITALVADAEALAAQGDMDRAKEVLDEAYVATRSNIKDLRQGDTLTRTLVFESAEEEYAYELDRNDSHFMLLDLALERQQVPPSMTGRIEDFRGIARQHRSDAESLAGGGSHPEAIDSLNKSTEELLKAIRMTGLFIPG